MFAKIYALIILLVSAAAAGLYIGGMFTEQLFLLLGLLAVTLVFMGMLVEVPMSVGNIGAWDGGGR